MSVTRDPFEASSIPMKPPTCSEMMPPGDSEMIPAGIPE